MIGKDRKSNSSFESFLVFWCMSMVEVRVVGERRVVAPRRAVKLLRTMLRLRASLIAVVARRGKRDIVQRIIKMEERGGTQV